MVAITMTPVPTRPIRSHAEAATAISARMAAITPNVTLPRFTLSGTLDFSIAARDCSNSWSSDKEKEVRIAGADEAAEADSRAVLADSGDDMVEEDLRDDL